MHAYATGLQFAGYHLERLLSHMQLLAYEVPGFFTIDMLRQLATQLLNKNRIFGGAGIRLTVFRNQARDALEGTEGFSFLLESQRLQTDHYRLNEKGLVAGLCQGFIKHTGPLSGIRNASNLLYLLAEMEGQRRQIECNILLNEAGRMVETSRSNIFLISGNSLFTPDVRQGCVPGIMRRVILELAAKSGYRINDQCSLTPAALEDAEEVFVTNAMEGIQWVGAYGERRYYKKVAKTLVDRLNECAF
jgi:branched-chain amino acid aminotransferase